MLNFSAARSVLVRKAFDHNLTGGAGVSHSGASVEWGLGFLYKTTDLNVECPDTEFTQFFVNLHLTSFLR